MANKIQHVAAKVSELGEATVLQLMPHFPHLTKKQIQSALRNGQARNIVSLLRRVGRGDGASHGIWGPTNGEYRIVTKKAKPPMLVNSVWDLAK